MLSVVIAIYNTFKQLSRHNTEDLCVCAGRAMLSAVVFTNGRQMAYALDYYRGLGGALELPHAAGLGGARPPNAFGLSRMRLVTTSLVVLCDRVACSITGHITSRQ